MRVRLLALTSAAVAVSWVVWPLPTTTGPASGSTVSACTRNQRHRPRDRAGAGGLLTAAAGRAGGVAADRPGLSLATGSTTTAVAVSAAAGAATEEARRVTTARRAARGQAGVVAQGAVLAQSGQAVGPLGSHRTPEVLRKRAPQAAVLVVSHAGTACTSSLG